MHRFLSLVSLGFAASAVRAGPAASSTTAVSAFSVHSITSSIALPSAVVAADEASVKPVNVTAGQQYNSDSSTTTFFPLTNAPQPNVTEVAQFINNAWGYATGMTSAGAGGLGKVPHGGKSWTFTNQPFKKGTKFTFTLQARPGVTLDWGNACDAVFNVMQFFSCQPGAPFCEADLKHYIWTQFNYSLAAGSELLANGSLTF